MNSHRRKGRVCVVGEGKGVPCSRRNRALWRHIEDPLSTIGCTFASQIAAALPVDSDTKRDHQHSFRAYGTGCNRD
jgi:hypothetical protein